MSIGRVFVSRILLTIIDNIIVSLIIYVIKYFQKEKCIFLKNKCVIFCTLKNKLYLCSVNNN